MRKTRKSEDAPCYDPVMPMGKLAKKGTLSAEKKADLKSMLKFIYLYIYGSARSIILQMMRGLTKGYSKH